MYINDLSLFPVRHPSIPKSMVTSHSEAHPIVKSGDSEIAGVKNLKSVSAWPRIEDGEGDFFDPVSETGAKLHIQRLNLNLWPKIDTIFGNRLNLVVNSRVNWKDITIPSRVAP